MFTCSKIGWLDGAAGDFASLRLKFSRSFHESLDRKILPFYICGNKTCGRSQWQTEDLWRRGVERLELPELQMRERSSGPASSIWSSKSPGIFLKCVKRSSWIQWRNKRRESELGPKISLNSVRHPKSQLVSNRVWAGANLVALSVHSFIRKVFCTCFWTVHAGKRWVTCVSLLRWLLMCVSLHCSGGSSLHKLPLPWTLPQNLLACIAGQVLLNSSSSQCLKQGLNAPHGSQPAPGLCIEKWFPWVHSFTKGLYANSSLSQFIGLDIQNKWDTWDKHCFNIIQQQEGYAAFKNCFVVSNDQKSWDTCWLLIGIMNYQSGYFTFKNKPVEKTTSGN